MKFLIHKEMILAHDVLKKLGATLIFNIISMNDPETEEDFNKLQFESPQPITWIQYQEKLEEVKEETGLYILRGQRKFLLQQTDWIMTVDSFQLLLNKNEWVAYRKMLRDLPTNHPPFVWKEIGVLDFEKMGISSPPPILRDSSLTQ